MGPLWSQRGRFRKTRSRGFLQTTEVQAAGSYSSAWKVRFHGHVHLDRKETRRKAMLWAERSQTSGNQRPSLEEQWGNQPGGCVPPDAGVLCPRLSVSGFLNRAVLWCCGPTTALIKQHQVDRELLVLDLVQTQVRGRASSVTPTSPLEITFPDASVLCRQLSRVPV